MGAPELVLIAIPAAIAIVPYYIVWGRYRTAGHYSQPRPPLTWALLVALTVGLLSFVSLSARQPPVFAGIFSLLNGCITFGLATPLVYGVWVARGRPAKR